VTQAPHILVVKYNALGDLLNITPSIRFIKKVFPHADIDVLTGEWSEPAIRHNPYIRNVYVLKNPRQASKPLPRLWSNARIFWQLRGEHYDAVLAFQKSSAFFWLVRLLGPRDHMMYAKGTPSAHRSPLDESAHVISNALDLTRKLLARLGCKDESLEKSLLGMDLRMDWTIIPSEEVEAEKLLNQIGIRHNDLLVGCVAGGGNNPARNESLMRQWGGDQFRELVRRILNLTKVHIILFGAVHDKEVSAEVCRGNEGGVFDLTGCTSVRVAAAVMAKCRLVITNDTGPMHIAGALGVPLVAVFGATGALQKLPPGTNFFGVQSPLECSPCYYSVFKGCIYPTIRCMAAVEVDAVLDIVLRLLANPPRTGRFILSPENVRRGK
jgi:heptosyltransferase II